MAAEALTPYGLRLNELAVLAITTTEEIQAKLDKLSQIEVDAMEIERKRQAELKGVGATSAADLGQYEMMKGIGAGQAKGGGGGAAGAGASMGEAGMAMMMPMMMMQMMNQMKQQTAPPAGAAPAAAPAPAPAATDLTTRLKKLKELFEGGLIDEATYKARREEILKEI
jgi:membrane protease subunit (stomatin/prohibitin family)